MYEMSNESPSESIWSSPEPGARKAKISRAAIADAALAIADEQGFDALSMRRVADRLEVGTMSLYHYIRGKDDLMALVDDRVIEEVLVPDGEMPGEWREALAEIARRSYASWTRRPWLAHIAGETPRVGPNMMRHIDQSLGTVAGLGLSPAEQFEIVSTVDDYTLGFVMSDRDLSKMRENDWQGLEDVASHMSELIQTGEFPNLEAFLGGTDKEVLIANWREIAQEMDRMDRFERGLNRLIDGIALDLERRSA
jgi:AcrR family transcriptional regulator